jgi:hypothetical protein
MLISGGGRPPAEPSMRNILRLSMRVITGTLPQAIATGQIGQKFAPSCGDECEVLHI